MADELQPAPGEELEPLAAPPEEGGDDTPPDPIEEFAKTELGWAPQAEFRGPPEDWKPAAEFIKAGREINRSMSRELRTVRDEVGRMARVSSQLLDDKLAERDSYWQGIHRKAVEDGDVDLAERAHTERTNLKAQAQPASPGLPPETADFMERHKGWMGKDPLATMRAETLAEELAKRGVPVPEQLVQVERAIRKEFPEHFAAPGKAAPGVQTGTSRNNGQGSRKKGYADMPPESRAMADDYQKRHGVPKENFAEEYWADQNERKVG